MRSDTQRAVQGLAHESAPHTAVSTAVADVIVRRCFLLLPGLKSSQTQVLTLDTDLLDWAPVASPSPTQGSACRLEDHRPSARNAPLSPPHVSS